MKHIEAVKHIVCYDREDFIKEIIKTIKVLEDNDLEADIQYSFYKEIYTALIIGRSSQEIENENRKDRKSDKKAKR